jgi:lysophospholipase
VYIPNAPYTSYTNFSTFQLSYTDLERDGFLENGFREARGNSTTLTPTTPALPFCLACALVSRAERRAGIAQTPQCAACFNAYCWDGVSNSSTPDSQYDPSILGVNPASQPGGAGTNENPTPSTTVIPSSSNNNGASAVRGPALPPLAVIFAGTVSCLGALAGSLVL